MKTSELELQNIRDRELKLKRLAGEISCAECRRLKLRCDKKIPCCSCIRRGVKDICPTETSNGSVRGNSMAVGAHSSSSEIETAERISAMSDRISALEDALQIAVGSTHPLLSPDMLTIKRRVGKEESDVENLNDAGTEEGLSDAFGTLTIGEGKSMQFLGASASEDVLLMDALQGSSTSPSLDLSLLPADLAQLSEMWPFVPSHLSYQSKLYQLGIYLPPYDRVSQLVRAYFSRPVWFVDLSQVEDELVPLFYPQGRPLSPTSLNVGHMHDLALFFMILTGGFLAEGIQNTLTNPEAERYHHLARIALSLNSIFENGSLSACQALILLASYDVQSGRKAAPETSWKLAGIGFIHAISIGLHRDPIHWTLDPEESDRRRWIFWELYTVDKWKCLGAGRPPLFPPHAVDCEFPRDPGITLENGSKAESVRQWKYRFSRDVLTHVADHFCSAKSQKYSDIMRLDKLVRDFPVHPFVTHMIDSSQPLNVHQLSFHPLFSIWWKERALLYVHRNYFARAILEHGGDPMRSPFSLSFLGAYRSASTILKIGSLASEHRSELKINTPFWAMSLSASIIIGSVASKTSISFAASALRELEHAIVFFRRSDHPVARHGLKILVKLEDKAISALRDRSLCNNLRSSSCSSGDMSTNSRNAASEDEEELHVMRGTTRRIERRTVNVKSQIAPRAPKEWERQGLHSRNAPTMALNNETNASRLFDGTPFRHGSHAYLDPTTSTHRAPFTSMDRNMRHTQPEKNSSMNISDSPQIDCTREIFTTSDSTSALDIAFEDAFTSQYIDNSYPSFDSFSQITAASSTPFGFTNTFSNEALSHQGTSQNAPDPSHDSTDVNVEGGAGSGDLWHCFIQQLGPLDSTDSSLANWEAMEFA
ncbi:hypothetical protein ACEPAH_3178 [Sanghuangporus vaninii]